VSGDRRFTLEEANAMLPELRERLERIREARRVVIASAERITTKAPVNGGGPETEQHRQALAQLRADLERVAADGVLLRDPESGLIDFLSDRDGEDVFLCWRLGEDDIGFWHPLDTGFGGRRPLR
jgi:hypothetical protein